MGEAKNDLVGHFVRADHSRDRKIRSLVARGINFGLS